MIALEGPYPPPYGGVAVHIKRFVSVLEKKKVKFTLFYWSTNKSKKNNYILCRLHKRILLYLFYPYRIIHTHSTNFKELFLLPFLKPFKKHIIITIHSSYILRQFSGKKIVNKNFFIPRLKKYDHLIVVNTHLKETLVSLGINKDRISVIPSFLFPSQDECSAVNLTQEILQVRKNTKLLITANAYKIILVNGKDLYGIDLSIELTKRLVDNGFKDIGFLFVIPDIGNFGYFYKMQERIVKYNLEKHFFFYTKPISYPSILNIADIFIRPTIEDGYGMSVAEALYLGVPVVASDVCIRAEGTVVFRQSDIDDLYEKTISIIGAYDEQKKKLKELKPLDYSQPLVDMYTSILEES